MAKKKTTAKKEQWAVTQEQDGVHVRPVVDGEIIDTPVVEVIEPEFIVEEDLNEVIVDEKNVMVIPLVKYNDKVEGKLINPGKENEYKVTEERARILEQGGWAVRA